MKKFQYQERQPVRVDKAINHHYPEVSRSQVSEWISDGLVRINGKSVKKTQKVFLGDLVSIDVGQLRRERFEYGLQSGDLNAKDWLKFSHEHFLVFEKPANVLVHRTNNPDSVSFIDAVLEVFPEIRGVRDERHDNGGNQQVRDGLVHRLDKETSGLIVVARTQHGFDQLKQKFAKREVLKEYYALVRGKVKEDEGEITFPIVRSKVDHAKRVAVISEHDQMFYEGVRTARSVYRVVSYYELEDGPITLVSVRIYTGRTHQIRVHMKAIGHTVWGDVLYGGKREKDRTLPRLGLHAYRLGFELDGEEFVFESDLPEELQALMHRT
jgi:23S rRNA pseudouridine1911/1915/1917 synthase